MKKILFILSVPFILKAQDCSCVSKKIDKFTGKTECHTSSFGLIKDQIQIDKTIGVDTSYYLFVTFSSLSALNYGNGLILLFEDGSKMQYDKEVFSFIGIREQWFTYMASMPLNREQVKKLSESKVTDFRVYAYDFKHLKKNQSRVLNFASCILKA